MYLVIDRINAILSGPIMVWGIIIVGTVISFKTKFVQLRFFKQAISNVFGAMFNKTKSKDGISPFQAVTTALAGTIGTGNIVGVATAIAIGGAGAIFWMWVSAFFGMATKYAEIVLAIKYRVKTKDGYLGGAMYYLEKAFKGRWVAITFAVICIFASFGMGNMVQSNAIACAVKSVCNVDYRIIIAGIALLVGFVIVGGIKRIGKVTEGLVPLMALIYMLGCVIIISMNVKLVPSVISEIFCDAFSFFSVSGGLVGFFVSRAVKVGFARGVFTNEAGLGSAPIAHAAADVKSPHQQGLMGIFEVFFDTFVMCSMTAFVILLSKCNLDNSLGGGELTLSAFSSFFGEGAKLFIAISTIFFAVSTILSWSYYGQACISYLGGGKRLKLMYKFFYIIAVYVGGVITLEVVWGIADLLNGLMMLPNLAGLAVLISCVVEEMPEKRQLTKITTT